MANQIVYTPVQLLQKGILILPSVTSVNGEITNEDIADALVQLSERIDKLEGKPKGVLTKLFGRKA